ncbi:MAG: tetratricopeptide repeat protein [Bacteroidetes bacterium]|nr:tetratricopeptide repeat protein [Bacteroidota bacterium]MCL1968058.1 tetratricopeptide repeat protein [Bacteroidota bacterium]
MNRLLLFLIFICNIFLVVAQHSQDEQLAVQYYQQGEYEKAKAIFKPLFDKKPDTYIYTYYYPVLLYLEDYKELEKVVKTLQKAFPTMRRYDVDLGYVYERQGDLNKALKEYDAAIKNLPAQEVAYRDLHYAFLGKSKRDYAIDVLLKGRKVLQNPKLFTKELVYVYSDLKNTDKIFEEAFNLVKDGDVTQLAEAQTIIQNLIVEDEEQTNYLLLKTALQKEIQKYPNNLEFVYLLYWAYQLNKEYADAFLIAKSLDKRSKGDGQIIMELASNAAQNRDYETAKEALEFIIAKGEASPFYTAAKFQLLDVKYLQLSSVYPIKILEAKHLEQEFKKLIEEYGITKGTSEWIRKYAHLLAFYVNKPAEAIDILNTAIANADIRDPKQKALYKVDLADILLFSGNIWDATLLYSQVDKDFPNDTIGQNAKYKNAKLAFYIGEFAWAKSQLNILRATTSKLIANDAMQFTLLISDNEEEEDDEEEEIEEENENIAYYGLFGNDLKKNIGLLYYARADFLLFQNNDEKALKYLDSIAIVAPVSKLNDVVLFTKAKIFTRQKKYLEAAALYQRICDIYANGLLGDDAIFYLGDLYEYYLKDISRAMECYQKLMKDYPGSLFVVDARKRFRTLRGDF